MELDLDRLCEQLGEAPRALPLLGVPAAAPGHRGRRRRRAPRERRAGRRARARAASCSATSQVFDVWRDAEALGPGRRSLALRLTFQAQDRTLSDEEVRPHREAIVEHLRTAVGAELRGP